MTNPRHYCTKDTIIEDLKKEIWELRSRMGVEETNIRGIKDEVKTLKDEMGDMRKEIQNGFKGISNKIIAAMGFVISILLTALGVLVYNYLVKG